MASIGCSKDLDVSSFTQAEACHSISSPNSSSQELKCLIERDLLAADLRISLFVSAAQNFKYETLLKPIPEKFKRRDGEVDIDKLRSMISKFPPLSLDSAVRLDDQDELLLNILTPTSHQLNRISFHSLVKSVGGKLTFSCRPPNFCFEVVDSPTRNQFWERKTAGRSTYYAFHGSRFENFYSILNLGLHQHLNKVTDSTQL
jgi:poly [ADP-ribose] polymerase 16